MGVAYGLLAAVLWGTADFFARLASERVGSRRTTFWMQCVALVCSSALLATPGARPHALHAGVLALACLIGVLNAAGAALLYRALEVGTVSLVSPISSTFAALTAGLAIGAGERPAAAQLAGLVATVAGVAGACAPAQAGSNSSGGSRERPKGAGLAIAAAALWGVSFFLLRYVVGDLGAVFPVVVSRAVAIATLGLAARVAKAPLEMPRGAWAYVVGIAVFDSGAFVAYNRGLETSLTAIVSVVSSLFSAVTVLLAFVVLRERLLPKQWAFVALILAGLALVSSAA